MHAITRDALPTVITEYLTAHQARDLDTAVAHYTPDGIVTDEGNTYRGPDEIRAWLSRAASEYTYTSEFVGAYQLDDQHFDVVHHLEGDFPGGVADLHFRFALRDARIAGLVIEP
ncbi:nuclear transport factor 2 family protein [Dactylosporangium sp. NPDC005572]|uniref:nuclear transport factor 2 family protein n=1 Tax=Dactylosporangium sp. NPDC005572 TaxID=3156889 RepID=UPI00339DBECD